MRRLTISLAAFALVAFGGSIAEAQYDRYDDHGQEYEYEFDEGVHEEEWYDPSDWFNEDAQMPYEQDWEDTGYGANQGYGTYGNNRPYGTYGNSYADSRNTGSDTQRGQNAGNDDWAQDHHGRYDRDYDWRTDDQTFDDLYGDADQDWNWF